jgi:hypothetical protein
LKLRLQIRDVGLRRQNPPAAAGRLRDVVAAISIAAAAASSGAVPFHMFKPKQHNGN